MSLVKRIVWQSGLVAGLLCQAAGGMLDAQTAGPVAAYSFDEGSGAVFADASGNTNAGTVSGATWAGGRFGSALLFDGVNDVASIPDAPSLDLSAAMTLEAWVYPAAQSTWQTVILKERSGHLAYAIYGNTDTNRPSGEVALPAGNVDVRGTAPLPASTWTHVAVTYDGATLRFFVNGVQATSRSASGAILASGDPLRIGGNLVWGEYFSGLIDEVRIYNRALSATEIQQDMNRPVATDTTPPAVGSVTPLSGATDVPVDADVLAVFNEDMNGATITASTVTLRDAAGTAIPATVTYEAAARRARLNPVDRLPGLRTFTARVLGGAAGVTDASGVPMASDFTWAFTTTDPSAPSVSTRSPAPGATNVASTVAIVAGFSEPMQPDSIAFSLRAPNGTTVPATVTYDATTLAATLRPSASLAALSTYTASVANALDASGTPIPGPVSWTFTTGSAGFQESIVMSGLTEPTVVEFASDGRVFVAEKSGIIKVFDSLTDTTPTIFADLRTSVHNFWDRGLLGMALDPQFPTRPYVYVLYAYDAAIGGTAPRWGNASGTSDPCPTPPGATTDGCVVSGRLSRLQAAGNVQAGPEQVLIEDWGQQYPSHSIGHLAFGPDGALYATGGDGASFTFTDYGQEGSPLNPLGDPPVPVGGTQTPPTAEGGALRSQDVRTTADPLGLGGTVVRLDPDTGQGLPDNPLASSNDVNARRVIAHGLRNPFRFTFRPGTREMFIGDVGWSDWEEINRLDDTAGSPLRNFGWPCYEGAGRQGGYDAADLSLCESLYNQPGAVTTPFFTYRHRAAIAADDTCDPGSSSTSGLAFYEGGSYPSRYNGALFFGDYSRNCIWVMFARADGTPNPSDIATFKAGATGPVQLKIGPGGDLFYVSLGGSIRRIRYFDGNRPPVAGLTATPDFGPPPLAVTFNAAASSDPDPGDTLAYAWDLDGDGLFTDGTAQTVSFTYTDAGIYTARVRVTDSAGLSDIRSHVITAEGVRPVATIQSPAATVRWRVGDTVAFSGTATDQDEGDLPASAFEWSLIMQHCSDGGSCHAHPVQTFSGVREGSFVAPDHEYPSYLELVLNVTDGSGLTDSTSVRLDAETVTLTFDTQPAGLTIATGSAAAVTPFTRTAILGSNISVSAPSPQSAAGTSYEFDSWSDGGGQTHNLTVTGAATYRATYTAVPSVSIGDASAAEPDSAPGSLSFAVSLSAPSTRTVTVDYSTAGGTASPSTDYTPVSGTLTFGPGVTTLALTVAVSGDTLDEANETVGVSLVNAQNAGIADGQATGTIVDNDLPVSIAIDDVAVTEGSGGTATAVFTVSLSSFSGQSVSVTYATAAGTAVAPADFAPASGTLVFLPGSLRGTVAVQVQTDVLDEGDETFVVNLTAPVNATIADAQGTGLIRDDDVPGPSGLVAAYGFEETSATQVIDASGNLNHGTISGATRTAFGRFGRAISFDGNSDLITVPDSNSLDLATGMTLEVWVNPRSVNQWRSLLLKERPGNLAYALYANTNGNVPSGEIATNGSNVEARGGSRLTVGVWTHLAVTFDGGMVRLYINGTLVTSRGANGTITTSTGALRIGGNTVWGEYFDGVIDEVRIYNRALSAAEIQADMTAAVRP